MHFSLLYQRSPAFCHHFPHFFTNSILILFPDLLSYVKQGNVIFMTEFVIQGLSFGSNYHMFCSVLGFGIIFLTATIFQTFYYLLFSVFTSFMELFLHRVWCLHLPFFYQPQTFSLAERTLFKIFVYFIKVIRIICPVICKKIV